MKTGLWQLPVVSSVFKCVPVVIFGWVVYIRTNRGINTVRGKNFQKHPAFFLYRGKGVCVAKSLPHTPLVFQLHAYSFATSDGSIGAWHSSGSVWQGICVKVTCYWVKQMQNLNWNHIFWPLSGSLWPRNGSRTRNPVNSYPGVLSILNLMYDDVAIL